MEEIKASVCIVVISTSLVLFIKSGVNIFYIYIQILVVSCYWL